MNPEPAPEINSGPISVAAPTGWLARFPAVARLYLRHEKYFPVMTFAAGFIWDSLTLTRIDRISDNLILLGYLLAFATMIVLTLRRQAGLLQSRWALRFEPHFLWAMQFLLGGMLSSYVVFYFKSVSWTQTQFFFILLVILLVGNEFLHHRLGNPLLLATLFVFCAFSFFAFFLPVVFSQVGTGIFLLSGALSFTLTVFVFSLAFPLRNAGWFVSMRPVAGCVAVTYVFLNIFYFANLIPPVPLGMKHAGIYHLVRRTADGYEVHYVPPPAYRFWQRYEDPFCLSPGESVYCYTSIFAPRGIRVPVHHQWSRYLPGTGWVTTDRVGFEVSGGREGGYRGFSHKRSMTAGKWRVEVATDDGAILGRIDFTVIDKPGTPPTLVTDTIR
jgi:hypothetical protein